MRNDMMKEKKSFRFGRMCAAWAAALFLAACAAGCGAKGTAPATAPAGDFAGKRFPAFQAMDFEGNSYTEALFGEHQLTVLNLWFTGCKACVSEMPSLEKLSAELAEKDVALVGLCLDGAEGGKIPEEGKRILEKCGVTYPNLLLTPEKESKESAEFLSQATAFPTTLLIDREGNVIGDEIVGSMTTEKELGMLRERIESALKEQEKGR